MNYKKDYGIRQCCICGKDFKPYRMNVKTCDDPECKKAAKKQRQKAWYDKNYLSARAQKREYMRRVREEQKLPEAHVRKPDTIVAIGYAERQMQKSLEMAGKINTNL